jgi:hypothetical protein
MFPLIYHKSTTTDTIIPQHSCHPTEHKLAAIRYLKNRNESYILNDNNEHKENETICHILCNNKYDTSTLNKCKRANNKKEKERNRQGQKWVKFTYTGKETRAITKLITDSNIKIAFTTKNNIGNLLSKHNNAQKNKYDRRGVYQLTCHNSNKKYIGQTGRPFHVRFKEHVLDYKYTNNKSNFAKHFLENKHSFNSMENSMEILHTTSKGRMLNTIG